MRGRECIIKAELGREVIKSSMSLRSKIGGSDRGRERGRVDGPAEQARSREQQEEPACEGVGGREEVSESIMVETERLPRRYARNWRCKSLVP